MPRGQSALEYLMTYGWALIIILIAAAALYAMGLLSPGTYQQKTCTGMTTLGYQDHFFDGSSFKIKVANEAGAKIAMTSVTVNTNLNSSCCTYNYTTPTNVNAGKSATFTVAINDTGWSDGEDYIMDVVFVYNVSQGITGHVEAGSCTGKVEA